MIRSIRHRGLSRLYEKGIASGVKADHLKKLRLQLAALDTACVIGDMDIPGFKLHPLRGKRTDSWAIDVSGNWRLTFRFESGDVFDVDYED